MRCLYSARAVDDFDGIAAFIARDNPRRALSFVEELQARCEQLVRFPLAAPLRPEIADGIRAVPFGHYLILYSVMGEQLIVERILHGARDIVRLFDGDD